MVEDWLAYARSERWIILRRQDLPASTADLLDAPLDDDHAERIRQRHLESYRVSHFGQFSPEVSSLAREFSDFLEGALRRHVIREQDRPTVGLDGGCATGGYTQLLSRHLDSAIGIDLHFERLRVALEQCRQSPGTTFLVANAEDPPFEPESFDVVLALNLVDSTSRPRHALDNLSHCLRAGGLLFVTTPFDYSTTYSAREEWISEPDLVQFLSAGFEILEDLQRLPWVLPVNRRRSDVFFVRALVARRR